MYKRSNCDEKSETDDSKRRSKDEFAKENFIYNEEKDEWRCPANLNLTFEGRYIRDGKEITRYGGNRERCLFCPHSRDCVTTKFDLKRGYRSIEADDFILDR